LAPSPRPANAEGVKDLVVLASYGETQFKIRLEEKFQGRPLAATIVKPFVKAFNKKAKSNTSNVYKQRLEVETLERLEIEGVAVDDLSAAASAWLPRDGMRATLYFPAAARPLGAPKPALEQPEGEPYTELVKRVKMSVEQIATAEDLAWSSKTLRPQDMVAFAALAKEYGPLNVVNLYACMRHTTPATRAVCRVRWLSQLSWRSWHVHMRCARGTALWVPCPRAACAPLFPARVRR
tara:strand:+ start:175 stop:885 length:711 start_codon:yes stop_codon:yes gene_type:complete